MNNPVVKLDLEEVESKSLREHKDFVLEEHEPAAGCELMLMDRSIIERKSKKSRGFAKRMSSRGNLSISNSEVANALSKLDTCPPCGKHGSYQPRRVPNPYGKMYQRHYFEHYNPATRAPKFCYLNRKILGRLLLRGVDLHSTQPRPKEGEAE